jgi:hypothetical protein
MTMTTQAEAPTGGSDQAKPEPDVLAMLQQVSALAQKGDRQAAKELKRLLDRHPEVWARGGDLAQEALEYWVTRVVGTDPLSRGCIELKLASLRAELLGDAPTVLERLVAERVLAGWLQVWHVDALYAGLTPERATLELLRELQRRQDSTQRRYLAAVKQLALVRRLLRPAPTPLDFARAQVPEGAAGRLGRRRGLAAARG